jgi:hypothetical protein
MTQYVLSPLNFSYKNNPNNNVIYFISDYSTRQRKKNYKSKCQDLSPLTVSFLNFKYDEEEKKIGEEG